MSRKKRPALRVKEFPAKLTKRSPDLYRLSSLTTVAKKTDVSEQRLRKLLRKGEISGDKAAGEWFTTVAAVKQYQQPEPR